MTPEPKYPRQESSAAMSEPAGTTDEGESNAERREGDAATPDGSDDPANGTDPAVVVEDLALTYGDGTEAVADLSLTVERGELFGFLGPNGAGKTTTIRLLTGRSSPDSGRLAVLGLDPASEGTAVRERVGILPEKEEPHSFQTAREYLRFVGLARELDDAVVDERIDDWADRLRFREKLDTLATDLSRGQQQKVMITAAFLHEPELVFIDEPLANLDPIMQERVKDYLVDYAGAGNTVFLSTHHVAVAEEICTRVGIVDEGELVAVRDLTRDGPANDSDSADGDEPLIETFVSDVGVPETRGDEGTASGTGDGRDDEAGGDH
jgi:ABC-2 type transport system ATP-binding protein